MRPKLLAPDEPRGGIQPAVDHKGRAIGFLRDQAGIAVLLVGQYLDFCRELADEVNVMERGRIVHTGPARNLDRPDVRKYLTVGSIEGAKRAACICWHAPRQALLL
jgi:urea transport system ATP-binding protein